MIEKVLLWSIVLLVAVVLLPMGVAFYQRIRVGTQERSAALRRAAARGVGEIPTSQPPDIPPVPTNPPLDPGRTRPVPLPPQEPQPPKEPYPEDGTVPMPWYGYLICMSGALEGKYFIVEPDGFWIGRPTAGSPVVIADKQIPRVEIADKRISKEHLRIVVRDGKVVAIDQDSTNGTFLGKAGGERITEVHLKRDDVLVLADNAATFLYKV